MENQCIIGYLKGLKISQNGAKVNCIAFVHIVYEYDSYFFMKYFQICFSTSTYLILFTEFEININSQGIKGYTYPNPMLLNVVRCFLFY